MTAPDLQALAAALPSMGGVEIGERLQHYAAQVPAGQVIVEAGCWLGAGTAHLALGAKVSGVPIHVYDRWHASAAEVEKAQRFGVELYEKENTLPRVQAALEPFGAQVYWHRGDIRNTRRPASAVGLYVDDVSKQPKFWNHAVKTFLRGVPVEGVVVLMDYHFHEKIGDPRYLVQKHHMESLRESFTLVEDRVGGTTAAIFRRIA